MITDITKHPHYLEACKAVAEEWRTLGHAIRKEGAYASHVTEETKKANLDQFLDLADEIETGTVYNFTILQRVHYKLTGESVALLP